MRHYDLSPGEVLYVMALVGSERVAKVVKERR
jgi:hypothetical protein